VLLRAIAVRDHGFKLAAIGSAQLDVRSLVHPLDSRTRVLQESPSESKCWIWSTRNEAEPIVLKFCVGRRYPGEIPCSGLKIPCYLKWFPLLIFLGNCSKVTAAQRFLAPRSGPCSRRRPETGVRSPLRGGGSRAQTGDPPPSHRTGLCNPGQERNFSMQRRRVQIRPFFSCRD
jgi:hypothetical protein